jgi:HCOMODA/2-hydroxy-3-carboxy-muconic semialdehyde decarboxylase
MPPTAMSLSTLRMTPKPRHGFGAYFAPQPPLWDDPQLVRSDEQADGVAAALGGARAVVMRGNGVVAAAPTIEEAVVLTWYLEDAARVELDVLATGAADCGAVLSEAEAGRRAVGTGRIYERMWEYLTDGDPE